MASGVDGKSGKHCTDDCATCDARRICAIAKVIRGVVDDVEAAGDPISLDDFFAALVNLAVMNAHENGVSLHSVIERVNQIMRRYYGNAAVDQAARASCFKMLSAVGMKDEN